MTTVELKTSKLHKTDKIKGNTSFESCKWHHKDLGNNKVNASSLYCLQGTTLCFMLQPTSKSKIAACIPLLIVIYTNYYTVPKSFTMEAFRKKHEAECQELGIPDLPERSFLTIKGASSTGSVRIMGWNILAQALCNADDNYVLCPPEALEWGHRKYTTFAEIARVNPTILCVQELDKYEHFKSKLSKCGYHSIFFPKPESPCLFVEGNAGPDGCAIFYKHEYLELLDQENIVLLDGQECETNQVAIICKFKMRSQGNHFLVATTHLKAKTGYEDLRNEQGRYLLDIVERKSNNGNIPVLICGDFNAKSNEKVYVSFQNSLLNIKSAYTLNNVHGSEPKFTTWKMRGLPDGSISESCKAIDYIWYSTKQCIVNSVFTLPLEDSLGYMKLPSLSYPSDHLALACDVSFT